MTDLAAESFALVQAAWQRGLRPEPQITVSAWADRHRVLPGTNAEPGAWRTDRTPYLREIQDALSTASPVERIVLMKGAQTGGTEAALNAVGYWIAHAPGLILAVSPSLDMVRRNSRTRIDPLLEGTPILRAKVTPSRSKDPGNTVALKEFAGGHLVMTGANSATGLRSTPARYLILDEVDAFPADADGEGDPVALAIQRTVTFRGRRKVFLISTPTESGVSRIEKAYAESDQRRWHVACPHCADLAPLTWQRIRWPEGAPARAFAVCEACGGVAEERDKPAMNAGGAWRPTAQGDGSRGYHLPALVSPFEAWGDIAQEFVSVKSDPIRLKSWVNLKLGEPYEDRDTASLAPAALMARAEPADPPWSEHLPAGVVAVTAGVDVQDSWLAVEIVAWGVGEESWSLAHEAIHGDTSGPEPWRALDAVLARRFAHPRAVPDLPIAAVAIDSGGHRTDLVMRYSAERLSRRVWAIKGRGGPGVPPWPRKPPRPQAATLAPVHIVGVDALKATLLARLRMGEGHGPGVCHVPADRDYAWFAEMLAERPIRRWHKGVARIEWLKDPGVRNEALDCRVYALAALHGAYAAGLRLEDAAKRLAEAPMKGQGAPPKPPAPRVIPSKWMSR